MTRFSVIGPRRSAEAFADECLWSTRLQAGLDADLTATGDPDVLLFDYEEWRPCGLGRRISADPVAARDGPRLVPAAERTAMLRASWVCWNKAYRRDFVAATGLRFPPAGHRADRVDPAPRPGPPAGTGRLALDPPRRCR